jgi:hypothetical protein
MKTLASSLLRSLASLFLLLPFTDAFALIDQAPPTAGIVAESFSPMRYTWQQVSGTWSVASGTYGDTAVGATHITTLTDYRNIDPAAPPSDVIDFDTFTARARMRNSGTTDAQLVGLVYGYQDSQNYYEVVVSALGNVTMRTVMGGVAVNEAPAINSLIPRNTWFEIEVRWSNGVTSVNIDGKSVYTKIAQPEFTSGKVGLVTHGVVGRFDNVSLTTPFGNQPFLETFAAPPYVNMTAVSGQWAVSNKTFVNSAIQQTNIALAPFHTGIDPFTETPEYTFRARMLNPYGNTGNLVGIVFNYEGNKNYAEVVFSPLGLARLNVMENGVLRTLASANYGGTRNVAFDVTLENRPNQTTVLVNGVRLFTNLTDVNPSIYPSGDVGLITHFDPGRFDNVQFDYGVFRTCSLNFQEPFESTEVVNGQWDVNGGTLNSTAIGFNDIVRFGGCPGNTEGDDAGTNYVYSARLLNDYGNSGNRVGMVYGFHDSRDQAALYAGDYFEVTFSGTGVVQLNKNIEGVLYPVRTLSHDIPPHTWFDVQVIRTGILTTIKLNGATIVSGLPQGEIHGGDIGAKTQFTKGHFDNVTFGSRISRPASEL